MPKMKRMDEQGSSLAPPSDSFESEEEREDYLDYCAADEALDEALEKGGIKKTRDFAKELGFDF